MPRADGATVFPPAYQQVLKGLPAVNYSARDIIYRPRNVRAHRVYGYSPVQQVLMTVNIALRRQLWQLDYFTEGSIPDALIGVPQGWTPDQIKQFQDYWDTEFAGDLAKRRRAKFVPGETAAQGACRPRSREHKDDFDEWLARIICFAFSVPPQWATKAMNRATADNQSAQAEEEGLEPTKEWVKDLIDEIIGRGICLARSRAASGSTRTNGERRASVLEGRRENRRRSRSTKCATRSASTPSTTPPPTDRWCSPPRAMCRSRRMRDNRRQVRTDRTRMRKACRPYKNSVPTSRALRPAIPMAGSGQRAMAEADRHQAPPMPQAKGRNIPRDTPRGIPAR